MDGNCLIGGNAKAQFWSFDVVFAIIIFSIAITILAFTWYSINNQLALGYGSGSVIAQLQAHELAQELLSPGSPAGWQSMVNTTNTNTWANVSIGLSLAPGSSNLSVSKLYALSSMAGYNYQATKQPLGVAYDYYIIISGGAINMTIGSNPSANGALSVYVEKRNAFLGGTPVTMTIMVWTNQPLAVS